MICLFPAALFILWAWLRFFTRFPERTIRDVYPFFRYIDGEILVGSFHPDPEEAFKASHSAAEFRKWQLKRIHLAIHLCKDISANSRLLLGWAVYERNQRWQLLPKTLREGLREFRVSCLHSRTAAFAVRFRLRLRLIRMGLFPFLPVPSFQTLVEHSNDMIMFYGTSETLAQAFSLSYEEEVQENMLAVLGMAGIEFEEQEG